MDIQYVPVQNKRPDFIRKSGLYVGMASILGTAGVDIPNQKPDFSQKSGF